MNLRRKGTLVIASMLMLLLLFAASVSYADPLVSTYQVTITNLTTGQPFTPPLAVTHRQPISAYALGAPASFELKEIAENGNLTPMIDALSMNKHVSQYVVAVGTPPPLLPGGEISFEISGDRGAKYLSFVSMLICTNDGFAGLDSLRLPKRVGDSAMTYVDAYDAGTEINTEDFADLVPPCPALTGVPSGDPGSGMSNPALAEGGAVMSHAGIQGGVDLVPAIHGWSDPVAQVVVTRID